MSLPLTGAGASAASAAAPALTLTATTTGAAQTVTIHSMTPAAGKSLVISWGDGNSTTVSAGDTGSKANTYASAGSYAIRVTDARDIVQIDLRDAKLSGLKSSELAESAITYFFCNSITNTTPGRFDSADVSAWPVKNFYMYSMPSGYAGTFDSADVSAWTPTSFYLHSMPSGYAGTFDSADVSAWTPTGFALHSMPVATFTFGITDSYSGWVGCNDFYVQNNGLLQADVDTILWSLYQAALSRTVTGGTINLGGTNAAPSGTYQAAAACPVSVATPGKEVAHELQNDGCDAIAAGETWTTVTVTA